MVKETGHLSRVAQDLDLSRSSLVAWVRQAEVDAGQTPHTGRGSLIASNTLRHLIHTPPPRHPVHSRS